MNSLTDSIINYYHEHFQMVNAVLGLVIFLVALILRNVLSKVILAIANKLIIGNNSKRKEPLYNSLIRPLSAFFTVLGLFIGIYINYQNNAIVKLFKISVILIICWALVNYFSNNLFLILHFGDDADSKINTTAIKFVSNIFKIIVIAFAVVMAVSELGYNINGLITGIGVGGLAVSLAAQDAVSNLISGFIIVFEKPFIDGDFIQTKEIIGTVEEVAMRSTKIRTLEDSIVTIPNSNLTNDAIVNISRISKRLIDLEFGLKYSTTNELLEKCQNDIKEYLTNSKEIVPYPIRVEFTKLDASSLNLTVFCYTSETDINKYHQVLSTVNYKVKEIIENNGAEFAFPSSSIYIEK